MTTFLFPSAVIREARQQRWGALRRFITGSVFFWLFVSPLWAAELAGPPAEPKAKQQWETPFLWQVEKTGRKPVYLFGTIHAPDPVLQQWPATVKAAFDSADIVLTELALDPQTVAAQSAHFLAPKGETIKDKVSAKTWQDLDQVLKSINPMLSAQNFNGMKLWALWPSLPILERQMKYPMLQPLDMQIYNTAKAAGKQAEGLESFSEQFDVFEQFSDEEHARMMQDTLDVMLKERQNGKDMIDVLMHWYLRGDLSTFEKLYEEYAPSDERLAEKFNQALIIKRNRLMAERIQKKMQQNSNKIIFAAVGAAHMAGETGLPSLLQKAGYTVTRIGGQQKASSGD